MHWMLDTTMKDKTLAPIEASVPPSTLHNIARLALFAALTGAGSFIHIPFGPAHISLQTMMVMLTGFVLGPKKAILAMLLYLACGFIGLPMFGRGKAGPASFFGPTVGYLAGFVAGAAIAGFATYFAGSRCRRLAAMLGFGLLGSVALLAIGAAGMRLTIINDWHKAFAIGFYPFLPGDCLKMFAAAAICAAMPSRASSAASAVEQ